MKHYAAHGYPEFLETAKFLQIIRDWFDVINVKRLGQAGRKLNERRNEITKSDRRQLEYLSDFFDWLEKWEQSCGKKGLSSETFYTAKVTTKNFISLGNYLLDQKDIDFVLLGLISQDFLEGRFGWRRQLCGGNYLNSVLQFLQAERSIRIRSLVKMGYPVLLSRSVLTDLGLF